MNINFWLILLGVLLTVVVLLLGLALTVQIRAEWARHGEQVIARANHQALNRLARQIIENDRMEGR